MSLRFDDSNRLLALSVRDLIAAGAPTGHLILDAVQSRSARMAAGRAAHQAFQAYRAAEDPGYRAEVESTVQITVDQWTVTITGRLDGIVQEEAHTIVEEIKSTALDYERLYGSDITHWDHWVAQLEVYLWMLAVEGWPTPTGRLVLISLLDGSRHVLGVPLDKERVSTFVHDRLRHLTEERERRIKWLKERRGRTVPNPFPSWRPGQEEIIDRVHAALDDQQPILIEAPTGLGKTGAILHAGLQHTLAKDRQLMWATSRNTQQDGIADALQQFRDQGLPLRSVRLRARERGCINDVVACHPDTCRFATDYHDKIAGYRLVERLSSKGAVTSEDLSTTGHTHEVCPVQLGLDLSHHVDVIIGDVNYALSPDAALRRHFGPDTAQGWVVVADEAHQLVPRAREWRSPQITSALARDVRITLDAFDDDAWLPFIQLATEVESALDQLAERSLNTPDAVITDGWVEATLLLAPWKQLSARFDDLGLDYALVKATRGEPGPDVRDPWTDLARSVFRFSAILDEAGSETIALVDTRANSRAVRLLCRDPSGWLGPAIHRLGGFVGCSATLSPDAFYRDLLGLPETTEVVTVPSHFDPSRSRVLIAPRVSTAWRDRTAHADATAALLAACINATPGNVAVYFPSFDMLDDISARWDVKGHDVMCQHRGMDEDTRRDWLDQLRAQNRPLVLAAVLGGIFAEGIDLPGGALCATLIVGPSFPPVGLEQDLLRRYYEARFNQGFLYAFIIPGITRVIQAAGRLVRTPEDRGVIVLVGRRFRWRDITPLFPAQWSPVTCENPAIEVAAFWEDV